MERIYITKERFIETVGSETGLEMAEELWEELLYEEDTPGSKETFLFLKTLTHHRKTVLLHKGVKMPKQDSRDWVYAESIIPDVNEFCFQYGLDKRTGYKKFIEIGCTLMPKFRLGYFSWKLEKIYEITELRDKIEFDPNKSLTTELVTLYQGKVLANSGVWYRPNLEALGNFVDIAKFCKDNVISTRDFIEGAFRLLEFKKGIPNPSNMLGEKFLLSIAQYKAENYEEPSSKKVNLKQINRSKWSE
jgi:hypothetical protein